MSAEQKPRNKTRNRDPDIPVAEIVSDNDVAIDRTDRTLRTAVNCMFCKKDCRAKYEASCTYCKAGDICSHRPLYPLCSDECIGKTILQHMDDSTDMDDVDWVQKFARVARTVDKMSSELRRNNIHEVLSEMKSHAQ